MKASTRRRRDLLRERRRDNRDRRAYAFWSRYVPRCTCCGPR